MTTTAELAELTGRLAEFVKQVQAGHEVVLTQDNKPVAKLVSAFKAQSASVEMSPIRSFAGRRVLTPVISQTELAGEMFGRQ